MTTLATPDMTTPSMTTTRTAYTPLIKEYADKYSLDADLVEALVLVESGGHADAFRFEPKFWDRYQLGRDPTYAALNPRRASSSYGLCQLMYPTAREMGFADPDPEYLFVPSLNLDYGCARLRLLFDWADTFSAPSHAKLMATLAAYNGGKGGNTPTTHPPRNGRYAEQVLALATALAGTRFA